LTIRIETICKIQRESAKWNNNYVANKRRSCNEKGIM